MSIRELRDTGLSDHDIRRRVRRGQLLRVRPGLFADDHQYRALDPSARQLLHHRALDLAATVPPVFCLASAALVHGMGVLRLPPRLHTVSPPGQGTHNGYASVVRHQAELPEPDVVVVHGLRATSPERTLLDCARLLPFTDAVVLVDQAGAYGLTRDQLEERLAEWAGRRGVRRARSVLEAMDSRSESVGETLTRLLLSGSRLPAPELQWTIVGRTGTYRADFAWPDHWLVLEFDGESKYATCTADVIRNERRREVEIQELGWTVLRVGWNDVVRRPAETLARVEAALRRSRGAR
ncbi:type IV toxin-antitoxin system AbiEi family antitoxin domain-containing protein [Kocuria sp. M1R5S2]|uniref:type IV toxin-antitoxin system AbiEi family antitoxin domain-containing protein n=1 Tax=Kocuria rhizosphaerae TaxID=3376285 RepID=UPI0037B2D478